MGFVGLQKPADNSPLGALKIFDSLITWFYFFTFCLDLVCKVTSYSRWANGPITSRKGYWKQTTRWYMEKLISSNPGVFTQKQMLERLYRQVSNGNRRRTYIESYRWMAWLGIQIRLRTTHTRRGKRTALRSNSTCRCWLSSIYVHLYGYMYSNYGCLCPLCFLTHHQRKQR